MAVCVYAGRRYVCAAMLHSHTWAAGRERQGLNFVLINYSLKQTTLETLFKQLGAAALILALSFSSQTANAQLMKRLKEQAKSALAQSDEGGAAMAALNALKTSATFKQMESPYGPPEPVAGVLTHRGSDMVDYIAFYPADEGPEDKFAAISPPDFLQEDAPQGVTVHAIVTGSMILPSPLNPSQDIAFNGEGARVLEVGEDTYVIYGGTLENAAMAHGVPAYFVDVVVVAVVAPTEEGVAEWDNGKGLEMAKSYEGKLEQKYLAALRAGEAAVSMPGPGRLHQDANVLNASKQFLNALCKKDGQQLKSVVVQSNDWEVVRHKVTGETLYRWAYGAFSQKNPDGRCMLHGFKVRQNHNGNNFSNEVRFDGLIMADARYGKYMDCSNAK